MHPVLNMQDKKRKSSHLTGICNISIYIYIYIYIYIWFLDVFGICFGVCFSHFHFQPINRLNSFARQNALSAAASWLRGHPQGSCLLEVRGCSQRGEVPWRQQDQIRCMQWQSFFWVVLPLVVCFIFDIDLMIYIIYFDINI